MKLVMTVILCIDLFEVYEAEFWILDVVPIKEGFSLLSLWTEFR